MYDIKSKCNLSYKNKMYDSFCNHRTPLLYFRSRRAMTSITKVRILDDGEIRRCRITRVLRFSTRP